MSDSEKSAIEPASVNDASKEAGEKDYDEAVVVTMPAGGSTSFAEYDDFLRSAAAESAVDQLSWRFRQITDNIFNEAVPLAEKARKVMRAARDLMERIEPSVEEAVETATEMKEASGDNPEDGSFRAFKDADDTWRWFAVWSSEARDRDYRRHPSGERFALESHKEYIDWTDRTGYRPTLRAWHVPGADIGLADMLDVSSEGFTIAAGHFQADKEYVAANLAAMGPLGVSHGYTYEKQDRDDDGVYHRYRTFEISVLPWERAANQVGTGFVAGKEVPMLNPRKKEWLKQIGLDADGIERSLSTVRSNAEKEGVSFKEVMDSLIADVDEVAVVATKVEEGQKGEEGDGPSTSGVDPFAQALAEVRQMMGQYGEQLASIAQGQKDILGRVEAVEQSDDVKIADVLRGRRESPRKGFVASEDATTEINGKEASEAEQGLKGDEPFNEIPAHLREHYKMLAPLASE